MRSALFCAVCSFAFCLSSVSVLAAGPATQESPHTLVPGKNKGTFHFVFDGRVRFTLEPGYPAVVLVEAPLVGKVAQKMIENDRPFRLEVDLLPGSYMISSTQSAEPAKAAYWPATGIQFHIDKDGNFFGPTGPLPELLHVHKITGLSPDRLEIAASDPAVLKWDAVPGAKRYDGHYECDSERRFHNFQVTAPHYDGAKATAGEEYFWSIYALGADGQTLAAGFGYFFPHGTDPAFAARVRAEPGACPVMQPPTGPGYLGIRPMSEAAPADPKTVQEGSDSLGRRWMLIKPGTKMIPAIRIIEVVPGSPAIGRIKGDGQN